MLGCVADTNAGGCRHLLPHLREGDAGCRQGARWPPMTRASFDTQRGVVSLRDAVHPETISLVIGGGRDQSKAGIGSHALVTFPDGMPCACEKHPL